MRNPWFGPKTVGWEWTPVTWQGWALSAVFIVATLALSMIPGIRYRLAIIVGLLVVFIAVVALTGTRPGGNL